MTNRITQFLPKPIRWTDNVKPVNIEPPDSCQCPPSPCPQCAADSIARCLVWDCRHCGTVYDRELDYGAPCPQCGERQDKPSAKEVLVALGYYDEDRNFMSLAMDDAQFASLMEADALLSDTVPCCVEATTEGRLVWILRDWMRRVKGDHHG